MNKHIESFLKQDQENLLEHNCTSIPKERLMLPEPNFVDRSFIPSDRSNRVVGNLEWLYSHGRLVVAAMTKARLVGSKIGRIKDN